ncbi:MAG: STAS domain-containing protein [Bacteroidota bacterium]
MTKVTRFEEGGIIVIEPKGELIGGTETDDLRNAINDAVSRGNTKLVIDLGKVHYINSTALGLLTSTHVNYTKRNSRVVLCNVEKQINSIFIITKLALIFEVYKDQNEALACFSQ